MSNPQTQNPKKKMTPEILAKLEQGYRYVTVPSEDIYEQPFDGIHITGGHGILGKDGDGKPVKGFQIHLQPGTHLLPSDLADDVEDRLKVWQDQMIRLMRPGRDKKSEAQASNRGQKFVPATDAELEQLS